MSLKEKLSEVFNLVEFIVFRMFVILSILFSVTVLLLVEWSRLRDLAHLLGFR